MTREELIEEIAIAACNNFEFSCCWAKAAQAAHQECRDLRQVPERSLILHCVNRAKLIWQARSMEAKASCQ